MGCGGQLRAHTHRHTDHTRGRQYNDEGMLYVCPHNSQTKSSQCAQRGQSLNAITETVKRCAWTCVCVCYDVVPWSACFPPLLLLLLQGCCDKNSNGLVPCDGWASVRASQPRPAGVHAQKPHVRSNQTWTVLYLK